MIVSTKGRYALRVMVDLAVNQGEGYVPLKKIAARQEISEKYLEAILKGLVRAKLLIGLRGKGGGYRLSRLPKDYTVGEIIRLTEGNLAPVACLLPDAAPCQREPECPTIGMWRKFYECMNEFLDGYTLLDLVNTHPPQYDYVI